MPPLPASAKVQIKKGTNICSSSLQMVFLLYPLILRSEMDAPLTSTFCKIDKTVHCGLGFDVVAFFRS